MLYALDENGNQTQSLLLSDFIYTAISNPDTPYLNEEDIMTYYGFTLYEDGNISFHYLTAALEGYSSKKMRRYRIDINPNLDSFNSTLVHVRTIRECGE